jgi:D-alanine-D-alanine ligase
MKIAILFDEIKPQDVLDDRDVLQQVKIVTDSLKRLGHIYVLWPCSLDLSDLKRRVLADRPDLAFNLLDTLDDKDSLAHLPVAVLDSMLFPHTGPSANILSLVTRKLMVKHYLAASDIYTPFAVALHESAPHLQGCHEWIIKGAEDDGSFGITDKSVVHCDVSELQSHLLQWQAKYNRKPFAEIYIEGREFTVPYLFGETLGCAEIIFKDYPEGKPKILGTEAKWDTTSFEATHTDNRWSHDPRETSLINTIVATALKCVQAFNLNGWGRIDFRVDSYGVAYVIDVNANSFLAPDAWFAEALTRAGISFDEAITRILKDVR